MAISMLKIRRPLGRLIFNMGIAIPGKTVFLIETAPCGLFRVEAKIWPNVVLLLILPVEIILAKFDLKCNNCLYREINLKKRHLQF